MRKAPDTGNYFKLFHFPQVSSTNEVAFAMAQDGVPEVTAVCSDVQKKGKGRRGRKWCSPPGGVYISFIVRPPNALDELKFLPVVVSYLIVKVLRKSGIKYPYIKWPNDVMVSNKKIAGVLVEARVASVVEFAVIGIGLNVNSRRPDIPTEATSLLLQTKKEPEAKDVLEDIIKEVLAAYREFKNKGPGELFNMAKKFIRMPSGCGYREKEKNAQKEFCIDNSRDNGLILIR